MDADCHRLLLEVVVKLFEGLVVWFRIGVCSGRGEDYILGFCELLGLEIYFVIGSCYVAILLGHTSLLTLFKHFLFLFQRTIQHFQFILQILSKHLLGFSSLIICYIAVWPMDSLSK